MKRCHVCLILLFVCQFLLPVAKAQLATDCTLYAAVPPTGNDANNGTTPATPKTLQGAANAASSSGSVICLEGGTYSISASFLPPHNGSGTGQLAGPPVPGPGYIKYEGYGDSPAVLKWTAGDFTSNFIIKMEGSCSNGSFCGWAYLHFDNFTLDGNNLSRGCLRALHAHHLIATRMTLNNCGAGLNWGHGDYYLIDHNKVFHSGYDPGLTQNLSGMAPGGSCLFDNYTGIHQVVSNNIVAGDADWVTANTGAVTDGNGLTQDQPCLANSITATTPSVLWLNNVAYMNGGRCFIGNWNTDAYFVNNTCYKNMLETIPNYSNGHQGEVTAHATARYWFINNIVSGWPGNNGSVNAVSYSFKNSGASTLTIPDNTNLWFTIAPNGISNSFLSGDPLFTSPPAVNNAATCTSTTSCPNLASAPDPATIGNAFTLQATSPAIRKGIDPSTLAGLPTQIVTDLQKYIYTDINGNLRAGGAWDLGAYQFAPPAPPAGLTTTVH